MKELIRTNDLILISRIQSLLDYAAIHYEILDIHTSIVEGSINAIQKRIIVFNNDIERSKKLIQTITNNNENQ